MADQTHQERTQVERGAKPAGVTGPGGKGAMISGHMGAPGSPSGPNEIDGDPSGVIQPEAPVPPGEDQIGLIGGDPGAPLNSQTGNPNWEHDPVVAAEAARHTREGVNKVPPKEAKK